MVVMKKLHTTTQNYTSNEKCFQLQIPMNFEFIIPDNDSVRLLSQFVEEMDLTCLYDTYNILKENQVTPRQMLKILLYAYLDTKYASRVIETACKRDVNYIYLLEGKPAPDHATIARFRSLHFAPCAKEFLTQCTQLLYELGEISGKKFFIDGTKMEANANKYTFVWKRKYTLQKQIEQLSHFLEKAKEYNQKIYRCGKRNSYAKTDPDATFMRMKEDAMKNGQLKPAYNVQIAVENYFIVHSYVSSDRTDYNTLIPVLEKHRKAFGEELEAVTADSGYCSEKNLSYLKENGIKSYIKLQDLEKRKTRAYKADIGKYYNMSCAVFEDEYYYICHDGRELRHMRTESRIQDGYTQTFEVYGCANCSGCEHKAKCLYKYDAEKHSDRNKVMKINERWEELKEETNENIQSEEGILKRQTRSIQTEGHFGDIKENENFRRFHYRSKEKVYKEFMLYAIGRNIMKYHRFLHHEIEKYEGKKEQKTA